MLLVWLCVVLCVVCGTFFRLRCRQPDLPQERQVGRHYLRPRNLPRRLDAVPVAARPVHHGQRRRQVRELERRCMSSARRRPTRARLPRARSTTCASDARPCSAGGCAIKEGPGIITVESPGLTTRDYKGRSKMPVLRRCPSLSSVVGASRRRRLVGASRGSSRANGELVLVITCSRVAPRTDVTLQRHRKPRPRRKQCAREKREAGREVNIEREFPVLLIPVEKKLARA